MRQSSWMVGATRLNGIAMVIASGALAVTACGQVATTSSAAQPATTAARQVLDIGAAPNPGSFKTMFKNLPQKLTPAEAAKILVSLDPAMVARPGYGLTQYLAMGLGYPYGYSTYASSLYYPYGSYYYPYSYASGYYSPYSYSTYASVYPYSYTYSPFYYHYGSLYRPYYYLW